MIAIGVFSVVLVGIFGVLGVGGANYYTNLDSLGLQQQTRQGMYWLSREVRQASWNSVTLQGPDANGNNSITFNTLDPTAGTGVHYFVTKTLVSGKELWQLQRTDSEHPEPKTKANDIKALTLSLNGPKHLLNIRVQAGKTIRLFGKDQTLTFSLNEQIQVRNSSS